MLQTLSKVALVFFIYFLLNTFYTALLTIPSEADSLYYHIPLAHSILSGNFLSAPYGEKVHMYFPASVEIVLALFVLIHIPVTLFNWFAIILLNLSGYALAKRSGLSNSSSILFAVAISLLQTVTRWIFAQTVDVWLAVFYLNLLRLLLYPKVNLSYWILIGILSGLLIGTKYSGLGFAFVLCIMFGKKILRNRNWKEILLLLITAFFTGGFWYLRNWIVVSNPLYPLDSPFFVGLKNNNITEILIWKTILDHPVQFFNAYIGEYALWAALIPIYIIFFVLRKRYLKSNIEKILSLLALGNFFVFLFLPSGDSYQLAVSQFRFSYVVSMPLILAVFLRMQTLKKEKIIGVLSLTNILAISGLAYYPKLLFLLIPVALIIFFPDSSKRLWRKVVSIVHSVSFGSS